MENYNTTNDKKYSLDDYELNEIKILDQMCIINRREENLAYLTEFSDMIPYYDDANGLHLKITNKGAEPTNVPLSNWLTRDFIMPASCGSLSDDEYLAHFAKNKKIVLEKNLLRNTYAQFVAPSAVQSATLVELIRKKDAVVQFKAGTGKTFAFLLGLLWGFDQNNDKLQYVFVTSSHEVASQIHKIAQDILPKDARIFLSIGQKKVNGSGISGGFKQSLDKPQTRSNPGNERDEVGRAQVIVGTMGKIYDLFTRKFYSVDNLKAICVDEFDHIIVARNRRNPQMSTEYQINEIMEYIPTDAQRVFFSATVNPEALTAALSHLRSYSPKIGEPLIMLLRKEDYTVDGIVQYYIQCTNDDVKKDVLMDLLKGLRISQGIIFVNRITTANEIKYFLDSQEIRLESAVFSAEMSGEERKKAHDNFINNKIRLLISTDVTSRGIDVVGINVVINYDMPDYLEAYIHRVGRSGRFGKKGTAISLILEKEMDKIDEINRHSSKSKMRSIEGSLENLL